jgi:hypothetical protein
MSWGIHLFSNNLIEDEFQINEWILVRVRMGITIHRHIFSRLYWNCAIEFAFAYSLGRRVDLNGNKRQHDKNVSRRKAERCQFIYMHK